MEEMNLRELIQRVLAEEANKPVPITKKYWEKAKDAFSKVNNAIGDVGENMGHGAVKMLQNLKNRPKNIMGTLSDDELRQIIEALTTRASETDGATEQVIKTLLSATAEKRRRESKSQKTTDDFINDLLKK